MKRILLVGLLVGIALAVIGAEPVKVIMATTDDGRRVILMPDGKWNFVDAAPAPVPKATTGDREKLWAELVAYFKDWQIATLEANSGLIQTGWHTILTGSSGVYQAEVSTTINEDLTLKTSVVYRKCSDDPSQPLNSTWKKAMHGPEPTSCVSLSLEQAKTGTKFPIIGGDFKKFLEIDGKLKADLVAFSTKYSAANAAAPPSENKP